MNMIRNIPITSLAALSLYFVCLPVLALPLMQPSIPGLESSISRRIQIGVSRGLLSPMQANQLQSRLMRIEQKEQFLISTGRLNSFERARIAEELESLNTSLHIDANLNHGRHPLW